MRIFRGSSLKLLSACVAFCVSACAGAPPFCPAGLSQMVEAQLFFGDEIPGGGSVSAGQWQEFVDSEVTPRFPAGFTVLVTAGQWRRPDGVIERESGHELLIVFARTPSDAGKLDEIRSAYMRRFRQESVLLAESPVCSRF
jgi:hypothetical protein